MHEARGEDVAPLYAFSEQMSALIRSRDQNHLIALGTDSGDSPATSRSGTPSNYRRLHALQGIDLLDAHDFSDEGSPFPASFDELSVISSELDKPIFAGATAVGLTGTTASAFELRARRVEEKLEAAVDAGFVGFLVYDYYPDWSDPGREFDGRAEEPLAGADGVLARNAPAESVSGQTRGSFPFPRECLRNVTSPREAREQRGHDQGSTASSALPSRVALARALACGTGLLACTGEILDNGGHASESSSSGSGAASGAGSGRRWKLRCRNGRRPRIDTRGGRRCVRGHARKARRGSLASAAPDETGARQHRASALRDRGRRDRDDRSRRAHRAIFRATPLLHPPTF